MTITLKAKDDLSLYKNYISFLHPIFEITPQETEVLAMLMLLYNEIRKDVKNEKFINKLLFDSDNRNKITKELDISKPRYDTIISRLRTLGIIKNRVLNKLIVPPIKKNSISVNVLISKENETKKKG